MDRPCPKSLTNKSKYGRAIWFWLGAGTFLLLLALLLHSPIFKEMVDNAVSLTTDVMNTYPVTGAAVFFLFSAVSAMLAFASSVVLVPPANLVWGKFITFLLLWGGWTLLSHLGYKETLAKYQQFVSKRMKFWAVLLFCIAVPSEVSGYLFGGAHYPFFKFLAAIAIAESIYAFGMIVAAESLVDAGPFPFVAIGGILIVVAGGAGLLMRGLKRRKAVRRG